MRILKVALLAALCLAPVSLLRAQSNTVTDIDGNVYQTVRIGSQIWMKENLKTTRLNDGTPIKAINDEAGWRAAASPACCVYSNAYEGLIPNYKDDYGLLYNGHAVATGKLAPSGWHVPTREEWMEMINSLGGMTGVGAKVKEAGTNHWRTPNHLADNSSGFSARAAGFRHNNGACDDFGGNALFWSSTSAGYGMAGFCAYFAMKDTWMWNYPIAHGLSVRCIKDSETKKSPSATGAPLPVAPAAGGATEPQELMKELVAKYDANKDGQLDGAEGAKMSATDMARWSKAFPEYASMSQPQTPAAGVRKTATEQIAPTAVPTQADSGNAPETVTDIDGNVYHTVKIGNQVWLKEDLKTTRFNDGTPIPYVTSDAEWGSITTPAFCWYNHDIKHKNDYGALYNFWAGASGKLAPKGWHVPSADEWRTLVEFVSKGPGGNQPGSRLRERGLDHWIIQNWNATDDYGFSLRGGGYRIWTGYGFDDFGTYYNAFSATADPKLGYGGGGAFIFSTYSLDGGGGVYSDGKRNGFSIRCVKDK